jgi:hypothetical protein
MRLFCRNRPGPDWHSLRHQHSFAILWQRTFAVLVLLLGAALARPAPDVIDAPAAGETVTSQYALAVKLSDLTARQQLRTPDAACSGKQSKLYALAGGEIPAWAPERTLFASRHWVREVPHAHAPRAGLTRAPPLA